MESDNLESYNPGVRIPALKGQRLLAVTQSSAQELCERRGGRPGLTVPNGPYGLCGRKATLNLCSLVQSSGAA